MENRLHRFTCKKLPIVDKSIKEIFARDATLIIHWMASKLENIDLFGNKENGNPPYEPVDFRPKRLADEPGAPCRKMS